MSEHSVPQGTRQDADDAAGGDPGVNPDDASNGTSKASREFCEIVGRDLGIKVSAARTAFIGEPTRQVLGVVGWAMDKSEDPDERSRMVLGWAKKRRAGAFRPPSDEYISLVGYGVSDPDAECANRENLQLAKLLLRYWNENPLRFARVLDELEIWMNVCEDEFENGAS